MSVYFDRVSRTFIFAMPQRDSGVTVRQHEAPSPGEHLSVQRQRMRAGARELLRVLAEAERAMSFAQIQEALPHVGNDTLQVRLSCLVSRDDIERYGSKGHYRYALPEGSTFLCT